MKLHIKICGPRASGKTIIMCQIKSLFDELGVHYESEVCEDINTENLAIWLSKNDLKALGEMP